MALNARDKMSAAIIRVTGVDPSSNDPKRRGLAPYFGAVLRGLIRREMDDMTRAAFVAMGTKPTLGVTEDGILIWDPAFVDTFREDQLEELALVLIHEVMHIVLEHHKRAKALGIVPEATEDYFHKSTIVNMAEDACINEELLKIGKMPDFCVTPEKLGQKPGLIMEERYRLLLKEREKQQQQPQGGQGDSKKKGKMGAGSGWCGGCSGHPMPNEPKQGEKDDKNAKGESGRREGRSEAELSRMRKQVAEAVKEHTEKNRGYVPGTLSRWADQHLAPPRIPWQEKLARAVRGAIAFKSGAVDLTWKRPSRRQAGVGFGVGRPIVPSLHAPLPRVGVLIDTSGSMSEGALAMIASELQGILSAVGSAVTVVTVDAELQGVGKVNTIAEAVKLFKGGGGTVLMPGWEAMLAEQPAPDVIVACTDGFIGGADDGYPAREPDAKVVWCIIEGSESAHPCPYGEYIYITKDDIREERAA